MEKQEADDLLASILLFCLGALLANQIQGLTCKESMLLPYDTPPFFPLLELLETTTTESNFIQFFGYK